MFGLLNDFKKYEPKKLKKIKSKEEASTNTEKLYNNRGNVIKAFENGVFPFSDGFKKKRAKHVWWIFAKLGKNRQKRFDRIKNQNQNAKNDNLQARPERGSPTYFNESYKLIQDIEHSKITHEKALKMITDIRNDIKRINDLVDFNENQVKVLNSLFIVDKVFTRELKWYKIIDSKYKLLRSKSNLNLTLKIWYRKV